MDSGIITIFLPTRHHHGGIRTRTHTQRFCVSQHPKAVLVALFCQLILLVSIAFILCKVLALPPLLAVGLMLLAASPGGSTANLFSYLFKGDLALNITLTAINSVVAAFTFNHEFLDHAFYAGQSADQLAVRKDPTSVWYHYYTGRDWYVDSSLCPSTHCKAE